MFYDPRSDEHGLPRNPWTALVTPRPIGWISSLSADGVPNLGPYSFFNAAAGVPPFVTFSSTPRKDSLNNIDASKEFAVNIVSWDLREQMNLSSGHFDPDVDEFRATGLTAAPCRNIKAPRVAESPIALECVLYDTIELKPRSGLPCKTTMVIGEVVGIHISDEIIVDGFIDVARYRPVCRLGYMEYAAVGETFTMHRPDAEDMARADYR
ncbi:flavin reductase family protein [Rhodobacterales bacterium HKCCE2091]|nr:flavin reductase family protein [Rhodobacterales bacterium HKCCE2091]